MLLPSLALWSLASFWPGLGPATLDPAVAPGENMILQKAAAADDGDDGKPDTIVFHGASQAAKPGGPWLGIQFGPVSRPLAAQLRLDADTGQMVMNVVENSPADQAGLQQYDIIVDVDGQKTSSKINDFMSVVREFKPGEAHTLSLLRAGQRIGATLTVGARPEEIGPSKYKYDDEELSQGRVLGRGGMLQKDDRGNWAFKGFNMPDLPDFWKAIPAPNDLDFQFNIPLPGGHGNKIQMYMKRDEGKTLRVEKADDGKITVITTVKENGKESTTTKTYANQQELEASDPDASKMLSEAPPMRFEFLGDGKMHMGPFDADMRLRIEEAMKNADGVLKNSDEVLKQLDTWKADGKGRVLMTRKARTSFEVTPDGKVKVTTRSGDDEITSVYDNADALKAANPDAYRKFERLQERTKQPKD